MLSNALLSALLLLGDPPKTSVYLDFNGNLRVVGDAGDNYLTMDDWAGYPRVRVGFGQTLNGVPGPTEIQIDLVPGRLIVDLGDGNDTMFINVTFGIHQRVFDLGSGDDFIDIGTWSEWTKVYAGPGNDYVHMEDASSLDIAVDLGPGNDDFELMWSVVVRSFTLHAGDGDDAVRFRYSELYKRPARVFGGAGVDELLDIDSVFVEPPQFAEFENLPGDTWISRLAMWTRS